MPTPSACRAFRLLTGQTLFQVALKTGAAPSTLSLIERGQVRASAELKVRLSQALGAPVSTLFPSEQAQAAPEVRDA